VAAAHCAEEVANVTGKDDKTGVVRCGPPRPSARTSQRTARLVGISEIPVSPHFLRRCQGTYALRRTERADHLVSTGADCLATPRY
jgi:hypothetical protein